MHLLNDNWKLKITHVIHAQNDGDTFQPGKNIKLYIIYETHNKCQLFSKMWQPFIWSVSMIKMLFIKFIIYLLAHRWRPPQQIPSCNSWNNIHLLFSSVLIILCHYNWVFFCVLKCTEFVSHSIVEKGFIIGLMIKLWLYIFFFHRIYSSCTHLSVRGYKIIFTRRRQMNLVCLFSPFNSIYHMRDS